MAHSHAEHLEVRFDDGRDPQIFRDVSYTPWNGGLTVYADGWEYRFELAYAVVGEPEPVR